MKIQYTIPRLVLVFEMENKSHSKLPKAVLLYVMVNCMAFSAGITENGRVMKTKSSESLQEFAISMIGLKTICHTVHFYD